MSLEKELKTYEEKLPELIENKGRFVLIKGDEVIGIYDSYEDALKFGYEKFGLEDFLVNEIQPSDYSQYFTRNIAFTCLA